MILNNLHALLRSPCCC